MNRRHTAQQDTGTIHLPLTVEQVVKNVEQSNRGRARALHRVEGVRVYRLKTPILILGHGFEEFLHRGRPQRSGLGDGKLAAIRCYAVFLAFPKV
jgi:hypothetical protein